VNRNGADYEDRVCCKAMKFPSEAEEEDDEGGGGTTTALSLASGFLNPSKEKWRCMQSK